MTVATIILNVVLAAFVLAAVVGGLWRSVVLHRREELTIGPVEAGHRRRAVGILAG